MEDTLERLVAALEQAVKEKSLHTKVGPANQQTGPMLTQPGGMFAITGLANDVISLHVSPKGLGSMIPAIPASLDDPRYAFLTGFSDDIGAEADYPCDDAPTGYMKAGTLTAQFGRVMKQTNTVEIDKTLHMQRGVNTDLRLMNQVLNGDTGLDIGNMDQGDLLNLVVKMEMVDVGVRFERTFGRMLWDGTITANSAHGGYKEFPGLDSQIATGQKDAENGMLIPSADSLIYNFSNRAIDDTEYDIVEYLSMMEFYLRDLAERTNMAPVQFALTMRPELWFELSALWPCRYLSYRCADSSNGAILAINDNTNVAMRDTMRNGKYIDINGNRYPVILDDGIPEFTNTTTPGIPAGSYSSAIYFVPIKAKGNFPTLYWEYIDYRRVQAQIAPLGAGIRNVPFWTDGGKYLWVYRDKGYCFDLQAKIEPRVILRTPHLAGKIQNIRYSPLTHLRSAYPDSPYFRNGGASLRPVPALGQAVWRP